MVTIKNLTKKYKSATGAVVAALDGIDLELPASGLVAICGKSGSGKTTLVNCLAGIDKFEGQIVVDGCDLGQASGSRLDAYRNGQIGLIFQDYNLVDVLSCKKNIELSFALQGRTASEQAVEDLLVQVGLSKEYGQRRTNELSGGEKQRVAVARTLAKDCKIILADEPTGNLDTKTSQQIFELLYKISQERLVVVITHDRESADKYTTRVIELADGKMIGDRSQLINDENSESDLVAVESKGEKVCVSVSTVKRAKSLPLQYSVLFGFKILLQKVLRLVHITVFPIMSMIVFGLALSTLFFDIQAARIQDWTDRGVQGILLKAGYDPTTKTSQTIDLDKMRERTVAYPIIQIPISLSPSNVYGAGDYFRDWSSQTVAIAENKEGFLVGENGLSTVLLEDGEQLALQTGRLPANVNEIAITNVIWHYLQTFGFTTRGQWGGLTTVLPQSIQEMEDYEFFGNYYENPDDIETGVVLNPVYRHTFKVVGVVETGIRPQEFYDVDTKDAPRKRVDLVGPEDIYYSLRDTAAFMCFASKQYLQVAEEQHLFTQYAWNKYDEHKMQKVWIQSSGDLETDKALTKDYRIASTSPLYDVIQHLVETATPAAIAVSILFLVFVSLSITSFVFDSIQSNKKLIGTLRSMGVKQRSIVSIFASESGLIALVIGAIGCALLPFMVPTLGILFFPSIAFVLSPFVYLSIFGVIALSTTLAIAGPLIKHSRTPIVNIIKR
ncbi:MAG: ATP-binding cassette domain-containing protein [Firmicutes bacterium]|nr:ATP-binding cassette domain-containing protein [Bacillota bacterium]